MQYLKACEKGNWGKFQAALSSAQTSQLLQATPSAETVLCQLEQFARAARTVVAACRARLTRMERECCICLDWHPWASMVSLVPHARCHDRVCRPCGTRHVETALADGKLYIRCPAVGCKTLLEQSILQNIASEKALAAYEKSKLDSHARRLRSISAADKPFVEFLQSYARQCPHCNVLIYRSEGCNHMSCKCGKTFNWAAPEAKINFRE